MASSISADSGLSSGTSGIKITSDNTGVLALQSGNNTTAITVDTSQNVGIGTATPSSFYSEARNLVVGTGTGGQGMTIYAGTASQSRLMFADGTSGSDAYTGFVQYSHADNALQFGTNGGTERMRIDSSGNLLVGQTSQTGSEKIGVTQSGATSATAYFYATAGNYSNAVITARCARGSATTEYNFLECNQVSTLQLVIRANGNVVNTNNSYGSISDIKLKENITDATPKLADLMQVKVRNYNLKTEPDHKQLGVIAQELETVFPAMVEETPDRDEEGNDLGTTTKSVKYSVFIPMLIKSIQEQQALITTQAETINALTARIVALEGK